jgi:hypothetical protein
MKKLIKTNMKNYRSNSKLLYISTVLIRLFIIHSGLSLLRLSLKGIVQRILTGDNTILKQSVLVNWRPARFSFRILKGHHHNRNIKPNFNSLKISKMALSGQSDATALFSAVRYTLCDTYIDFPQSVNSGKSIF